MGGDGSCSSPFLQPVIIRQVKKMIPWIYHPRQLQRMKAMRAMVKILTLSKTNGTHN